MIPEKLKEIAQMLPEIAILLITIYFIFAVGVYAIGILIAAWLGWKAGKMGQSK